MIQQIVKCLLPVALLSSLSACTATTDTTRFYTLKPDEIRRSIVDHKEQAQKISLESLTIPRLIDRPQIITRIGSNEIKRSEYHQWGGSIGEEIELLVIDTLTENLSGSDFYLVPSESRTRPDYHLHLAISRLNGELGQEAHIKIDWLLEPEKRATPSRQGTINEALLLTQDDYSHYVGSLQELIIKSVERLSEELKTH